MKALPCAKCGQAFGPISPKFPDGEPLYLGKANSWPVTYKCSHCKTTTRLPKDTFNFLPTVPEAVLAKHFGKVS